MAATTVFWCVGLFNRLMRLRARALDALGSLEKNLKVYASLVDAQFPHEEGAYIPLDWAELVRHVQLLDAHCQAARAAPLQVQPLAVLGQTVDHIEHAWEVLRAAPPDLAGPVLPDAMHKLWDEAEHKVRSSRGGFNQIVERYNEALLQFPARAVVRLMGFRPAGTV